MHACLNKNVCDRSAAPRAQWQDLELKFCRLLQHGKRRARRERVAYASLRPVETFMHACLRPTEAACFRVQKCSLLPYHTDKQSAVCAKCIYVYCILYSVYLDRDKRTFCTRKQKCTCISYTMMKSVLIRFKRS